MVRASVDDGQRAALLQRVEALPDGAERLALLIELRWHDYQEFLDANPDHDPRPYEVKPADPHISDQMRPLLENDPLAFGKLSDRLDAKAQACLERYGPISNDASGWRRLAVLLMLESIESESVSRKSSAGKSNISDTQMKIADRDAPFIKFMILHDLYRKFFEMEINAESDYYLYINQQHGPLERNSPEYKKLLATCRTAWRNFRNEYPQSDVQDAGEHSIRALAQQEGRRDMLMRSLEIRINSMVRAGIDSWMSNDDKLDVNINDNLVWAEVLTRSIGFKWESDIFNGAFQLIHFHEFGTTSPKIIPFDADDPLCLVDCKYILCQPDHYHKLISDGRVAPIDASKPDIQRFLRNIPLYRKRSVSKVIV